MSGHRPHFTPGTRYAIASGSSADIYVGSYPRSASSVVLCAVKLFREGDEYTQIARRERQLIDTLSPHPGIVDLYDSFTHESLVRKSSHSRSTSSPTEAINSRSRPVNPSLLSPTSPGHNRRAASLSSKSSLSTAIRHALVLEYCPGRSLDQFVSLHANIIDAALFHRFATQLAEALRHCHDNSILHADIKPQNILVTNDLTLKLCDFSKSVNMPAEGCDPPQDPLGLGTLAYCPPEFVHQSPSPFGLSADIYSLGLVYSFLLTGIEPFCDVRNNMQKINLVRKGRYWHWLEDYRASHLINVPQSPQERSYKRGPPQISISTLSLNTSPPLSAGASELSPKSPSSLSAYSDHSPVLYFLSSAPSYYPDIISPSSSKSYHSAFSLQDSPSNTANNSADSQPLHLKDNAAEEYEKLAKLEQEADYKFRQTVAEYRNSLSREAAQNGHQLERDKFQRDGIVSEDLRQLIKAMCQVPVHERPDIHTVLEILCKNSIY